MGAAVYTADQRAGAMHGKQFLLDAIHAGIDEAFVYGRLDFVDNKVPDTDFELVVNVESWEADGARPWRALRLDVTVGKGRIGTWKVSIPETNESLAALDLRIEDRPTAYRRIGDRPTDVHPTDGGRTRDHSTGQVAVALVRNFEFKLPLAWLLALPVASTREAASNAIATRLRLRFSLWQNGLPADALPPEGWMELPLLSQEDLLALW